MVFLKNIYNSIPYKKYIFIFFKIFLKLNPSIYRHFHFKGTFKVTVSNNKSFLLTHFGSGYTMESDFFWKGFGGMEYISGMVWKNISENSSVILDIGSNTGIYSLISNCCNPSAKIYAFEPSERIFKKLLKNINTNKYSIKAFQMAISEHSGYTTYFDDSRINPYTGSLKNNNTLKNSTLITVNAISLYDFILQNNIPHIDLIKIDVEEFEPEVLRGMKDFLYKFKPTLLIEVLNTDVAMELNTILNNIDYNYYNIDENLGLIKTTQLEKSIVNNYLVCTAEIFQKSNLNQFLISR